MHDLIIRAGRLVDGTGAEAQTADIAINDGIVTEVGRVSGGARPEMVHDLPSGARRLIQRARGDEATLVAGQIVMHRGEPTDARPGSSARTPVGRRSLRSGTRGLCIHGTPQPLGSQPAPTPSEVSSKWTRRFIHPRP